MSQEIYSIGPWIRKELTDDGRRVLKVKNRWLANFIHRYSTDPTTGERPFEVIDTSGKSAMDSSSAAHEKGVDSDALASEKIVDIRTRLKPDLALPLAVGSSPNSTIYKSSHDFRNTISGPDDPLNPHPRIRNISDRGVMNSSPINRSRTERQAVLEVSPVTGVATIQDKNKGHFLEDFVVAEQDSSSRHIIGVVDGHGTDEVARYVSQNLPKRLKKYLNEGLDAITSLKQAFLDTDQEVLMEPVSPRATDQGINVGAVAGFAVIDAEKITIGHVGNTSSLIVNGDQVHDLTWPTLISSPNEQRWLNLAGTDLRHGDRDLHIENLKNPLRFSRSFGDIQAKDYISADPVVIEHEIQPNDQFLIMGSDSIYEAFKNSYELARFIKKEVGDANDQLAAERLAKAIKDYALKHSKSNISVVVVGLDKSRSRSVVAPPVDLDDDQVSQTDNRPIGAIGYDAPKVETHTTVDKETVVKKDDRGRNRWLPAAALAGLLGCLVLAAGTEYTLKTSSTNVTPVRPPEAAPISDRRLDEVTFQGRTYRVSDVVYRDADPLYAQRLGGADGPNRSSVYGLARAKLIDDRQFNYLNNLNSSFEPWEYSQQGLIFDRLYYPDGLPPAGTKYKYNDEKVGALVQFIEAHNLNAKFEVRNGELLLKHGEPINLPADLQQFFNDVQDRRIQPDRYYIDQARIASLNAGIS